MSDAAKRALKRANDLLRLADPRSGASEAERLSAALEAAKVIAENKLVAAPAPLGHDRRKQPSPRARPPTPSYEHYGDDGYSGSGWSYEIFATNTRCIACGRTIYRGEAGWRDPERGTIHYDITCYET